MFFHTELEIHHLEHANMRQHHEILDNEVALILVCAVVRVGHQCLALVCMSREVQCEHRDYFIVAFSALAFGVDVIGLDFEVCVVGPENARENQRRNVPGRRCISGRRERIALR